MENQLFIKSTLDLWNNRMKEADALVDSLTDEQLQTEVSPGRNRGTYILGHLIAVHDRMLPLLNFEEQLYPQLGEIYITNPDKTIAETPSAAQLREYWKTVNTKLATHFNGMEAADWFKKHNSVSAEDFEKEPHRNRLNVVLGRTTHLAYHIGQLMFLKN